MTQPVAPQLFDVLIEYAEAIQAGKINPARTLASTSPALTFCENFYAQFFQNALGAEIETFNRDTKKDAVRLRVELTKKKSPSTTIQLITWFEELCDIYPNVLALGYGAGTSGAFIRFHKDYLLILLERVAAWAKVAGYPEIDQKSILALSEVQKALKAVQK